jgi:hypothetical protein
MDEYLMSQGYTDAAAVIVGSVLEDTYDVSLGNLESVWS